MARSNSGLIFYPGCIFYSVGGGTIEFLEYRTIILYNIIDGVSSKVFRLIVFVIN